MSQPCVIIVVVEPATTIRFASAARILAREARSRRLAAPGFRSPPRLCGADRSLRRFDQHAQVAVRVRGRPWAAVLADMIEGVVAANRLLGPEADRLRGALWAAVEGGPVSPSVGPQARVA